MKKLIPVLLMLSFVFAACGENDKSVEGKDKYQQTKETLEETEKKTPKRFLTVEGSDKKNLIGQTVIRGKINNTATVASFKDVDVELSFYSKTGALLQRDHEVVYETVAPGNSISFKTKTRAPVGTDSVAMIIYGAKNE